MQTLLSTYTSAVPAAIAAQRDDADLWKSQNLLALIFNSNSDLQALFRMERNGRFVVEALDLAFAFAGGPLGLRPPVSRPPSPG